MRLLIRIPDIGLMTKMGIEMAVGSANRFGQRIRTAVLSVFIALFAFCLPAAALEVGETIQDSVSVGGFTMPLPAGVWTVYYINQSDDPEFPTAKVGLILERGKIVRQAMYIRTARATKHTGFKPYPYCERPYYFYEETLANQAGNVQQCWHMRAEALTGDGESSERYASLLEVSKRNGYFLPLTMIGARYHFANRSKTLRVSIGWNPDAILRAPESKKVWRFEDWTADAIAADPRKKVIMTKFKKWSQDWLPNVENAFSQSN